MRKIIYWEKDIMDVELIGEHLYAITQVKTTNPGHSVTVYLTKAQMLEIIKEQEIKL